MLPSRPKRWNRLLSLQIYLRSCLTRVHLWNYLTSLLFFLFQNKSFSPQLETLQKQGSVYFFNPYEGLGREFFKHWNKFLIWTLISRQARLMFSWVSFPETRLQTDTARRLSRGSRKAPCQPRRQQSAEALHIRPVWAEPWFATAPGNQHKLFHGPKAQFLRGEWMSLASIRAGDAGMSGCHLGTLSGAFSITQDSPLEGKWANKRYFVWLDYLLLILSVSYFAF